MSPSELDTHDPLEDLNPALAEFVVAARAQPLPRLCTTADDVHEGWRARRRVDRASWVGGALALAAGLALVMLEPTSSSPPEVSGAITPATQPRVSVSATAEAPTDRAPSRELERDDDETPAPTSLAARVELSPAPVDGEDAVEVLGPLHLKLTEDAGARRVSLAPGGESLTIETPDRAIELRRGTIFVQVAGDVTRATLEEGEAMWIERDGTRTPITAHALVASAEPTARELAEKAERQLTNGHRRAAIRTLRALVSRHRDTPEARAGLLDLAGHLKAEGRADAASCAYQLYLRRNPKSPLRADIERALARAEPVECRGLSPRK